MKHILVFGASTTWGAWDSEGGWVERLRRLVDKQNITNTLAGRFDDQVFVYNLGISGDTLEGVLDRFEVETQARWADEDYEELIFLFSVGINDSIYFLDRQAPICRPTDFAYNLKKLVDKAKEYSNKIFYVGSMPVDESRVDPIPWLPGHSYKNEYVRQFNYIAKQVFEENGGQFIEIFDQSKDYKNKLVDGVHPNDEGHQQIFEIVKKFLYTRGI